MLALNRTVHVWSATPRVHLQTRVLLQHREGHQRTTIAVCQPAFGAAVGTSLPGATDQVEHLFVGVAAAQDITEVDATEGIEAEIPGAIGGQPTTVARGAERLGGRGDNAERRPIRQPEPCRWRRDAFPFARIGSIRP